MKKTAIIVGASSDIGLETAKKLASEGFSLALTSFSSDIDFQKELPRGSEFKSYKLDVANSAQIKEVFGQIAADFAYLDSLVFCVGLAQKRALIIDTEDEEIDKLFAVNASGAVKCTREFVKKIINKHGGNVVLLGSFVEKVGCSCESVYTAAKSGLSGFCKSLSSELGNSKIRINVVAPGFIDTKMNNNLSADEKEELADITPLGRLGKSADVANAIAFLCSEKADFITGQTLFVDGGLVLE